MKPNHLVDNILQATEILAKRYPGGWKNIRSIHLKTETSMSIPIHISNLSANDVGYVDTTAPQKVCFDMIFSLRSSHKLYILSRYLSRFFDCLAHPNLSATLATDQK